MALATQGDVEAMLGRDLTTAEASRVVGLLARADALVMGWLGCPAEPAPLPPAITSVVADMVARVLGSTATVGVEQVSVDSTSVRYSQSASSGAVWLTDSDRLALRRFRCGGGLTSVQLVSDRYKIVED